MAGTNDYLVPFGVDATKFFQGLNAMEDGAEKTAANVKEANQEMQKSFDTAASSGETFGRKLDMNAQKAQQLRDQSRQIGKDIGDALSGKNIGQGLEDRVKKIQQLMTGTSGKNVKLAFDFDEAKLEHFKTMIAEGADEFKILNQIVAYSKEQLANFDPGSEEWKQLTEDIQASEAILKAFGQTADEVNTKDKSLKAQLRELKAELAAMEIAGKENTQEFLNMSVRAGELEDQIGDISQRVRVLASDTKYIDAGVQAVTALAGGFAAAQGAMALFGTENEEINKTIQKVTGAMAVLQGIQAIANALNKDSALSVLLFSRAQKTAAVTTEALAVAEGEQAVATTAATVATKSWTLALLSNPVFLIIAGVAALITALIAFTGSSNDAEEAADKLNRTLEEQNTVLKLDEGAINRRTNLLVAQAKLQGKTESEISKIEADGLRQRLIARQTNLAETRALLADESFTRNLSADDFKKLQDKELEQTEDFENTKNELQVKGIELQTQRNKEAKEAETKRLENLKKSAAEQKAILDQQLKFRKQYDQAYIDSIVDSVEKEKQTEKLRTQQAIDELMAEKVLSAKALQERNDIIALLQQNLTAKLRDLDKKREDDRAQLLLEGQQKLAELQQDSVNKEIEVLHLGYLQRAKEIKEQFKNEGALRKQLLDALAVQELAETKKIRDQGAKDALNQDEERAVLEVELAGKFLSQLPHIEEQKQIEILKVKIDYAVRRLNLLRKQGADENSLEVLNARKAVQDLQKELGDAAAKLASEDNKFDFFKFLGLDDLSEEQKKAVTDAANSALQSVATITDAIVSQYQRQIDKKKELIDQENSAIKDLEGQLDKEKSLRDEGLANNVDNIQAELDAKKAQRDQDIRQQEELQKKQQAIQKVQFALDTATQASSLITSAANIFKALSPIPFIGVPLAITTIALMTGAFIAAKVKALQVIGDGNKQTFGEGGWIEDGKPHTRGGKKYRAIDGSGDVVELESGEHVTRATQAEKYADLLEAINDDRLAGMTEEALRDMLHEMGIHLSSEEPAETLNIVRERDSYAKEISIHAGNDITDHVKGIRTGVDYLAEQKKFEVKRWTDGVYNYEKTGNKILRTKIK